MNKKTIAVFLIILSLSFFLWLIEKDQSVVNIKEIRQIQNSVDKTNPMQKISNQEKDCLAAPLSDYGMRVNKKPFGIYVIPQNSPIAPENFSGYHTGTDFEIFSSEINSIVEVKSVCDGSIVTKKYASGYGGVLVQSCISGGEETTVVYGHLSLASIAKNVGDDLSVGEVIGNLGDPQKGETDGERKHLHFAIHKGTVVNILGYVNKKEVLVSWMDPMSLICLK